MEWQPIETAPKDDTHVILAVLLYFDPSQPIVGEAYFRPDESEAGAGWWWAGEGPGDYYAESIQGRPYAWMPLPTPPSP